MISDHEKRRLERMLVVAVGYVGLESAAAKLGISVTDLTKLMEGEGEWSDLVVDRFQQFREQLSVLGWDLELPSADLPHRGKDAPPELQGGYSGFMSVQGEEESVVMENLGPASGFPTNGAALAALEMPPDNILQIWKKGYYEVTIKLNKEKLQRRDRSDWHIVQVVLEANALMSHGYLLRRGASLPPHRVMWHLNQLLANFRAIANPRRKLQVRAKVKEVLGEDLRFLIPLT